MYPTSSGNVRAIRYRDHVPNESASTGRWRTVVAPVTLTGADYRRAHRDAVGAINILMRAIHGGYRRLDPGTVIRVTYLRAVERWSHGQRQAHRRVQRRKARARSKAPNRAAASLPAGGVAGEQASSSATVSALTTDPMVVAT
jgi:hypothetical protein